MKYLWNNPDIFHGIFMGYNSYFIGLYEKQTVATWKSHEILRLYMQWKSYENQINEINQWK